MSDLFTSQLSAYLDGELEGAARTRMEAHLAGCGECARILADLRAIVAAAPHYAGQAPPRDLWKDILARLGQADIVPIGNGGRVARPSGHRFGWRELIAASIVMAAVGGGSVYFALRPAHSTPSPLAVQPPVVPGPVTAPAASRNAAFAEQKYDAAVQDVEQLLAAGRSRLDTSTVRSVEENLRKIDAAISEAKAAIQRDPANAYLNRQITANMRRKLNLLRTATNAIAART
jgi:hypothetical protein